MEGAAVAESWVLVGVTHPPHQICAHAFPHRNGWTALHISASKGYEVIVRELLARGAAPNLVDKVRDSE